MNGIGTTTNTSANSRPRAICSSTWLAMALTVLAACSDSTGVGGLDGIEASVLRNETVTQVDRFGLPAINTAFVAAAADKNAFNAAVPADDAQFLAVASGVIQARYGLSMAQADALADFALPDVQPLGDLSGFPMGRRPGDDVIDAELGLIFGVFGPAVPPLQSDGVDANDVPFLGQFPYLAAPNTP
jgi:hypothetical protein